MFMNPNFLKNAVQNLLELEFYFQ